MAQDGETVVFESDEAFETWLGENHAASPGIWLKLRKKGPGIVALDYARAVDVALCYGWIDGQKAKADNAWWLQRFTPRRARSRWPKVNRDKVAALIEQGRMRPPGLAEIDRAKADGRWETAYDSPGSATVPDDLAAALTAALHGCTATAPSHCGRSGKEPSAGRRDRSRQRVPSRARQVSGPMTPSTCRWWFSWKATAADFVPEPNSPSTARP
ncbi:YdeI family protein [Streptomyces sp. NBC_00280]|uniref:YdeI/OmpD-associated family protein n=1 Tax=Streptomyces sp. NBC_00280 TaxID=2975699 RepID=UPI00324F08EA